MQKNETADKKKSKNSLVRGTLIILMVSILAKFSAFITTSALASCFGTSNIGDAYYMVSGIQQVVYPMLSVGIWKVYLPLYKEQLALERLENANSLTNKILTLFTMVSLVCVIFIVVFRNFLVGLIAPGFSESTAAMCSEMVALSAPMYLFIVAASVFACMLQCHNKFFASQIREVVSYIPSIIAIVLFFDTFGYKALAIALAVGGLTRLLVELPYIDWGYKFHFDFDFKTRELKLFFTRLPSALLSVGVNQVNMMVDKSMATTLGVGAVSCLNYGNRLMHVFSGMISHAVATAMYPRMVELITLNKKQELEQLVRKVINIFCILIMPITLYCMCFATEIVSVAFERGAFGKSSVTTTAEVFAFYCVGMFFVACTDLATNIFYSSGNTQRPLVISVINLIINVVLNLMLSQWLGVKGLALATSLAAIINLFVKLHYLKKDLAIDNLLDLKKIGSIAIIALGAAALVRHIVGDYFKEPFFCLLASGLLFVITYGILLKRLQVEELEDVIAFVKKKLTRKK